MGFQSLYDHFSTEKNSRQPSLSQNSLVQPSDSVANPKFAGTSTVLPNSSSTAITSLVQESSIQSLDGDDQSLNVRTTSVHVSPTYESQQKNVRFSVPTARTKKLLIDDDIVQLHSTHGISTIAHTKQHHDSTQLQPASSHGLQKSKNNNGKFHTHDTSRSDCVPRESHQKEKIEKQKTINDFAALLDEKIGKPTCNTKFGKPSLNHSFISEATFEHVAIHIFKSNLLDDISHRNLSNTHPLLNHLSRLITDFNKIDYSDLSKPNENFENNPNNTFHRRMAHLSCLLDCNFEIPTLIKHLGNVHTGDDRDILGILSNIKDKVPLKTYNEIQRILQIGSPAYVHGYSSKENFWKYYKYGNYTSVTKDPNATEKVMAKELKHSYSIPLPAWIARFVPNLHLTPQGLVQKDGKNDRLIFDASHLIDFDSLAANCLTKPQLEPTIRYGDTLQRHFNRIWNLKISYPDK